MKYKYFLLIVISFFLPPAFGQNDGPSKFVEEEYVNYRVAEEPLDRLASYRDRRMSTGALLSVAYSQFRPMDYDPSFAVQDFDTIYGGDPTQMVEFSLLYKLNFALGSISLGLGVGYEKLESDLTFVDSYLSLIPVRLEGVLAFDALFDNPYFVPYGVAGVYTVYYREEQAASAFSGTTQAAPYFGGGLQIRIDNFIPEDSFNAYRENYQENSFVYVEARQWLESSTIQDPDFSTGLQFGAGMRFEF